MRQPKAFDYYPTMSPKPRSFAVDNYPFDLDASLRFARPKTGRDFWPTHSNKDNFAKLGAVSGFMPQLDGRVWGQMWGKDPFGPIMNAPPVNLQWQTTVPGLTKQMPTS